MKLNLGSYFWSRILSKNHEPISFMQFEWLAASGFFGVRFFAHTSRAFRNTFFALHRSIFSRARISCSASCSLVSCGRIAGICGTDFAGGVSKSSS